MQKTKGILYRTFCYCFYLRLGRYNEVDSRISGSQCKAMSFHSLTMYLRIEVVRNVQKQLLTFLLPPVPSRRFAIHKQGQIPRASSPCDLTKRRSGPLPSPELALQHMLIDS